jgi:hypothetical protein
MSVLAQACYLMRNTGLDGNGTFGTPSFLALEETHPLRHPLAAQMLAMASRSRRRCGGSCTTCRIPRSVPTRLNRGAMPGR